MIWPDREAKKLKERGLPLEWVDDMKTPSGRIHVGSLRGVIVHDLIYKALKDIGVNAKISYVFNDMDSMDGLSSYLDKNKWEKYMGLPLYKIPSPEPGFDSFAQCYAQEFISVFNSINCHPNIIWSSELYRSGKMNEVIKLFLDKADVVRDIYRRVVKKERSPNWFPYSPVCQKCGKIGTTNTYKWDGKYVYYRCEPHMVEWAVGCGYDGKVEPINENGKLPWKLDWPAHWKVIGITVESSGKDHMSSGGSYDMGIHFCREILKTEPPDSLGGYEWFTIGGKKMSSSKGIGSTAVEVSSILPPDVFRFMQVRTPIKTHLDFNPFGETIPNLFDDYDRCMEAYFLKLENKIPEKKEGEVIMDFARIIELSEVNPLPKKRIYLPRFRTVVNLLKTKKDNIEKFFGTQKKESLMNSEEKTILKERIKFAQIYLNKYYEEKSQPIENNFIPSQKQNDFVNILIANLEKPKTEIQNVVFESIKQSNINPKEAFSVFYHKLINKPFGPKATDLITNIGINQVIEKLKTVAISQLKTASDKIYKNIFPSFNNEKIFSFGDNVKEKVPSMIAGIAIVRGIKNQKNNINVNKMLDDFIKEQSNLSTEDINNYSEIQSYRKILKFMGIDYHSRRPAPEALLRRVAQKKDLFKINACADIYNMVAMKYKVSGGVYDCETIEYPVNIRFAKENEETLLFGDKNVTKYKLTEIAWFDQIGGFINFGYRDSQRTAVTEKTKDVLITIEGVFDIDREIVEKALKMTIDEIIKNCGGKLETAGIAVVENNKKLDLPVNKVERMNVVEKKTTQHFSILNKPEIFSIDSKVAKKYPSINIGIAVIKNINIKKSDLKLMEEINQFVSSQSHLSNELISSYPEVLAYRKLYKEMGIDWHSRRPSPEALLRRISQKRDLYQINTCVDAYNLIVMKNRVSVGAFDYDKFAFPTIMRFPKAGEEILLLGDKEPTKFKETELAYFDQNGGYNIDFNYRDAQRTAVTENTKDILLNIDGIYDIDRSKVEQSLKESIEIIQKYCGGTVEFVGIVSTT